MYLYHIYLAIRWDFSLIRMTAHNRISPMKFCYNTSFTLPKKSQISRSVLYKIDIVFGIVLESKKSVL